MSNAYTIALIPGDGIGREVVPAAAQVVEATGLPIRLIELEAGWETFERSGVALPAATLEQVKGCDGALFGAVSSPSRRVSGYASPILTLRKELDLYANLRPAASQPVPGSRPGVDLLLVRENTECLYVKQEREVEPGERVIAERVITRRASARVAEMACRLARQRAAARPDRPAQLTVVHKANVLNLSDGLFRATALAVAEQYPDIAVEEQLVDSMVYRLIREPQRYDVVVAPNLYGDILSDAAAALVGGLGLAPSANVGDHFVVAEPVHGSAPDIAGRGIANPLACILAAALLLEQLGETEAAQAIRHAVDQALAAQVWTPDLGGKATTAEVTAAVLDALRATNAAPIPTAGDQPSIAGEHHSKSIIQKEN
ncbi:MAG TPA: isocitrate/isopropylmalate dehydrogenase family protein [Caldilineaceae bacterium]|nr:isocitrate/isopropylmalate dehydrogenase family protein [Caldilineaceae bacterium]